MTVVELRAGQRERDLLAGGDIRSTGDDRQSMRAGFDIGQDQPVGVRVLLDAPDFGDEHLVAPHFADPGDLLGFETGHGQAVGQLLRTEVGLDELGQPLHRNFHARTTPSPISARANWRRKRKSFPAKARISLTPYLTITNRSTPRPNAQPCTASGS